MALRLGLQKRRRRAVAGGGRGCGRARVRLARVARPPHRLPTAHHPPPCPSSLQHLQHLLPSALPLVQTGRALAWVAATDLASKPMPPADLPLLAAVEAAVRAKAVPGVADAT